jgi:hypothetical protein
LSCLVWSRFPELLDGHTVLDIECLDRICLNGYVPKLQVGGQVITFLHDHLGMPIVSPAVFEQIGTRFRRAVARFAENNDIPVIKFTKGIRPPAPPALREALRTIDREVSLRIAAARLPAAA